MRVRCRSAVVACGAAALLALLSLTASDAGASGSTTGVTSSTINIAYIYNDLSILTQEHLAPSDGNVLGDLQDIVDYLNAHGGVGGRKINLTPYKMPSLTGSEASDNAACLTATEQDHAFIVYIANAVDASVAQCTAAKHKTLTFLAGSAPPVQYFDQAQGRLFTIGSDSAMDGDRRDRGWAYVIAKSGKLKGKKIGVIVQGVPENTQAVTNDLVPELKSLGFKVAAQATVPFPSGSTNCSQTWTAIEVMKQAGVNLVFLAAYDLCGASVVTAAKSLDYKPTWATDGDNVTNTVAQFFAPAKDDFDGALGVAGAGSQVPFNPAAVTCVNKMINPKEHYQNGTDAFGIAAQACVTFQQLAQALAKDGSNLSIPTFITAMESQTVQPMSTGPPGSLGPHQHDASNYLYEERYDASQGVFHSIDPTPFKVSCPCAP